MLEMQYVLQAAAGAQKFEAVVQVEDEVGAEAAKTGPVGKTPFLTRLYSSHQLRRFYTIYS